MSICGFLEEIISHEELCCDINYQNEEKSPYKFYNLIHSYAKNANIEIIEEKMNFKESLHQIKYIAQTSIKNFTKYPKDSFINLSGIITTTPLFLIYPVTGGLVNQFLAYEDKTATILTSKYEGIFPSLQHTLKVHEFLHAYHYTLSFDLSNKLAVQPDFFFGRINVEPITYNATENIGFGKGPNKTELKKYEQNILKEIIKREEKSN